MVRSALVAILAAALGAAAEPSPPGPGDPAPEIPRVTDMPVEDAERILRAWQSNIVITHRAGNAPPDADLGRGRVLRQSRDEGDPPRTELYIGGRVPDLAGETRAGAERRLRDFGMNGVFQPADAPATSLVSEQDLEPGSDALWLTPVTVELRPAPVRTTRPPRVRVRVPDLIGLSVQAARTSSANAGLTLVLTPGSASDRDRITEQDPRGGRRVAPGTRISAVAVAAAVAVPSSAADATAVVAQPGLEPGLESDTTPASTSEVLGRTGGSLLLFLLLVLLAVLGWVARAPKRAGWVQAHVLAHPVGDPVGTHTTSSEDATSSRSIRIRPHLGPGRHTLEETSR